MSSLILDNFSIRDSDVKTFMQVASVGTGYSEADVRDHFYEIYRPSAENIATKIILINALNKWIEETGLLECSEDKMWEQLKPRIPFRMSTGSRKILAGEMLRKKDT